MGLGFNSCRRAEGIKSVSIHGTMILVAMFIFLCSPQTLIATATATDTDVAASDNNGFQFRADRIVLKPAGNSAEYIGNVIITQEKTVITADNVKVFFKQDSGSGLSLNAGAAGNIEDAIEKIVATGNVRIVSEDIVATASEAVYNLADGSLLMTGDLATVVSGANTMSAPVIEMIGNL